jgi:hypothetical protein
MPSHPNTIAVKPCPALRETFLRLVEASAAHETLRRFGDLLMDLVVEATIVTMPRRNEEAVSGTWVQHTTRALLLDLASVRGEIEGIREGTGEGSREDARLALVVGDLLADLDSMTARMQAALDVAIATEAGDGA